MSDLTMAVNDAQQALNRILSQLQANNVRYIRPNEKKVCENWINKARLCEDLDKTRWLFAYRETALANLNELRDCASIRSSEDIASLVAYGQGQAPMSVARVLAIDSYLATTWSIYDRITNVVGRLMGDESVANNPIAAQNPKIVEQFMYAKKCCFSGFGVSEVLTNLYAETIFFSYLLRNAYMHDGGVLEGSPILAGRSFGEAFLITQDVADLINEAIRKRSNMQLVSMCTTTDDLVIQLRICHEEIDKMFVGLLDFACESFVRQVSYFAL